MWHVLYGLPVACGEPGQWRVRLQNGDDFTPADEPPSPQRLCNVRAVTQEEIVPLEVVGDRTTGVEIDASKVRALPAWVVAETSPLPIELAPAKFLAYLQHEGLAEVIARRGETDKPGREIYSKYIKAGLPDESGAASFLVDPVGLPIEIVPITAGPVRVGDSLRARVLFRGSAAPGLQIRVSNRAHDATTAEADVLGRTDRDGEFEVSLPRAGYWRIHTIVMLEASRPEADWESWWACLTFSLS